MPRSSSIPPQGGDHPPDLRGQFATRGPGWPYKALPPSMLTRTHTWAVSARETPSQWYTRVHVDLDARTLRNRRSAWLIRLRRTLAAPAWHFATGSLAHRYYVGQRTLYLRDLHREAPDTPSAVLHYAAGVLAGLRYPLGAVRGCGMEPYAEQVSELLEYSRTYQAAVAEWGPDYLALPRAAGAPEVAAGGLDLFADDDDDVGGGNS